MHIHFVIHEAFEGPGAYLTWAQKRGYKISQTHLYLGDKLPQTIDDSDLLIVMGGPQSPRTTLEECPHFDAKAEIALIRQFVASRKPVIGVCLGSQLLGEAFGAPVAHSPEREIGNFPIHLTDAGQNDPLLAHFAKTEIVGHWHGDMPGLTSDAQVLAISEGCPRQIVRFAPFAYGFQCHLELTKDNVQMLLDAEDDYEKTVTQNTYVQEAQVICGYDYSHMNALLEGFLDKLVAAS